MQCRYHADNVAANTCNQCGDWLCEECIVDLQGRLYCRKCLAALASPTSTHSTASRGEGKDKRKISWGLLFFFSFCFPPGTNYMYMGLMKRGLLTMSGFFLMIFMFTTRMHHSLMALTGMILALYTIACVFDGFNIRRKINAGEEVDDNIDGILGGIFRSKVLTILVLGFLALLLFGGILGVALNILRTLLPFFVIVALLYFPVSAFRKKPSSKDSDNSDSE